MNNRSIAWWLRQIGLPQYTKILENEYYGLEGLLNVTDGELKDAGIEDATHRETILNQLSKQRERMDPHYASILTDSQGSGGQVIKRRVSRKYSLGSSMDLERPKDLFRQSVLPRLQRADKKHRLSASCSQLRPLDEDNISNNTLRRYPRNARQIAAFQHRGQGRGGGELRATCGNSY